MNHSFLAVISLRCWRKSAGDAGVPPPLSQTHREDNALIFTTLLVKQRKGDVKQRKGDVKQREGDVKQRKGDVKQRKGDVKQRKGDVKQRKGDDTNLSKIT